MAIYRGPGGSGDATQDAASEVLLAIQARDEAVAAKVAAEAAQVAAELAETNAETAETNAETAETNAETAATNAAASATNAANSATAAQTAETNAETAETNAAASASAASTSESNAATSATNASNSASAAATSATNASNSASAAATSATNAAASATSASNSASTATTQATNAANSATAAATSATNAATSAAQASAVALGNEPVRHSVRPSLLLDFANTKTLDPRITFTRASTGTFYDGKTVAKAEENLLTFSEQFDNAIWQKVGSHTVSANSATAPDGTTTADTITRNDAVTTTRIQQDTTIVSGGVYTYSVYAKYTDNQWLRLRAQPNATTAWFDIQNGIVGTVNAGLTATITSVGNSWYRCTITFTASGTGGGLFIYLADGDNSLNGISGRSIYLWGAQLEQRSSVTAYTATTTAPITNYIPALQTAASGVARFEHNPVTGESLGLEIEEQRTNLLTYSEQFNDAAWNKLNSTITSNTIIAPDGTLAGDKLVENTSNAVHAILPAVFPTITSGAAYTLSIYAKAAERTAIYVRDNASSSVGAYFDLSNGTVRANEANVTSSSIIPVGNGWYRCSVSYVSTTTSANAQCRIVSTGTTTSYTGDGWSGVYIWGAQLEAGAFATSYIKTEGSQVTRSADSASMTGTNFSSWYNAQEGSIYSEASFITASTSTNRVLWSAGFTASSNDATFLTAPYAGTSRYRLLGYVGSTLNIDLYPSTTFTNNSINKASFAYNANDFALSINAGTVTTDTSGYMSPAIDRFFIGSSTTSASQINGTIKKIAYYPKRLTNAELQSLTTV